LRIVNCLFIQIYDTIHYDRLLLQSTVPYRLGMLTYSTYFRLFVRSSIPYNHVIACCIEVVWHREKVVASGSPVIVVFRHFTTAQNFDGTQKI